MNNDRDCEHGQLARSCNRCVDAEEIAELRKELTVERMRRVRKEQQIETLLRGITDAHCLMDPIWHERMGAESVREYVQRGLRCIDSAATDCQFTEPNV